MSGTGSVGWVFGLKLWTWRRIVGWLGSGDYRLLGSGEVSVDGKALELRVYDVRVGIGWEVC